MPHKAHDQISGSEAAIARSLLYPPERFMAEDKTLLPRRRNSIFTRHDLAISAANAQRYGAR